MIDVGFKRKHRIHNDPKVTSIIWRIKELPQMETTTDDTWDLCASELINSNSVSSVLSLTKFEVTCD